MKSNHALPRPLKLSLTILLATAACSINLVGCNEQSDTRDAAKQAKETKPSTEKNQSKVPMEPAEATNSTATNSTATNSTATNSTATNSTATNSTPPLTPKEEFLKTIYSGSVYMLPDHSQPTVRVSFALKDSDQIKGYYFLASAPEKTAFIQTLPAKRCTSSTCTNFEPETAIEPFEVSVSCSDETCSKIAADIKSLIRKDELGESTLFSIHHKEYHDLKLHYKWFNFIKTEEMKKIRKHLEEDHTFDTRKSVFITDSISGTEIEYYEVLVRTSFSDKKEGPITRSVRAYLKKEDDGTAYGRTTYWEHYTERNSSYGEDEPAEIKLKLQPASGELGVSIAKVGVGIRDTSEELILFFESAELKEDLAGKTENPNDWISKKAIR